MDHFTGGELTQYDEHTQDLGLESPLYTPLGLGQDVTHNLDE